MKRGGLVFWLACPAWFNRQKEVRLTQLKKAEFTTTGIEFSGSANGE